VKIEMALARMSDEYENAEMPANSDVLLKAAIAIARLRDRIDELGGYSDDI
jgi:hypothetical protein